jgi:Na+-transporting NADH:ubiquinone oxidoreductase subunit NqrF
MFPDAEADADIDINIDDADDTPSTTQVGGGPVVQYNESSGAINITCKGISVCNPVTIINEKGGKKVKLDKLDKAAAKGRKKAGKNWSD